MTTTLDASFDVIPLEPTIGGEIRGIDLHHPLDADTVAQLRARLLERKVLVFRGQHLDPDELLRFAGYLGEPFGRPDYAYGSLPGYQQIVKIGPSPVGQRASSWHQGGT